MRGKRQKSKFVFAGMAAAGLLGAASLQAWSQERDTNILLREALVSPTTAYVPLPADFICTDGDNRIVPSPDGKDVLIQHTVIAGPRSINTLLQDEKDQQRKRLEASETVAAQLLLYSQGDDHSQVVWRGGGSMLSGLKTLEWTHWLPGTRTALIEVSTLPGPLPKYYFKSERTPEEQKEKPVLPTLSFLLINGVTGKSQTIAANLPPTTRMIVSFTDSVVVLLDAENGTVQRVEPGKIGSVLPLGKAQNRQDQIYWSRLMPDNRTLDGSGTEAGEEGEPRRRVSYRFDTITGAVSRLEKFVFNPPQGLPTIPKPLGVHRVTVSVPRDGVTKDLHPLWLEGSSKEIVGRTIIAPDSDAKPEPVVLESSVLYQYRGAVYAVPILKSSAPEFLAQRHEKQKREALERAKIIGLGMRMYAEDYDGNLPPMGGDFKTTVMPYVKSTNVFENPATGLSGFTTLYRGTLLSAMGPAATTPLASLDGPQGTAIIYADGHVQWQDGSRRKP